VFEIKIKKIQSSLVSFRWVMQNCNWF